MTSRPIMVDACCCCQHPTWMQVGWSLHRIFAGCERDYFMPTPLQGARCVRAQSYATIQHLSCSTQYSAQQWATVFSHPITSVLTPHSSRTFISTKMSRIAWEVGESTTESSIRPCCKAQDMHSPKSCGERRPIRFARQRPLSSSRFIVRKTAFSDEERIRYVTLLKRLTLAEIPHLPSMLMDLPRRAARHRGPRRR